MESYENAKWDRFRIKHIRSSLQLSSNDNQRMFRFKFNKLVNQSLYIVPLFMDYKMIEFHTNYDNKKTLNSLTKFGDILSK